MIAFVTAQFKIAPPPLSAFENEGDWEGFKN